MEIWKDIKGYEGIYQASDLGRIRTHENKTTYTKHHGVRKWKQRIMKYRGYTPKTGYRVSFYKNGKLKEFLVSRLIAFTFLGGDISDRWLTVNHKDGNRMNNHIDNLELVSLKENINHGFNTGLYSSSKKIVVINKKTNQKKEFRSMAMASKYMNKSHGYISDKFKKNIFEDDCYIFNLLT